MNGNKSNRVVHTFQQTLLHSLCLKTLRGLMWGFFAPTGLPSRPSEGGSVAAPSSVPEICQILDLSGPSDGAGGESGRLARV